MLTVKELRSPAQSGHVAADEAIYRRGFEAALRPETFETSYTAALVYLREHDADVYDTEAFRRGYECGLDYAETLQQR